MSVATMNGTTMMNGLSALRADAVEKGRWHGTTAVGTEPAYFAYDRRGANPDVHPPQFEAVVRRLHELTATFDGNGEPVVQLVFTRPDHASPVVAYRFTSDWAYRNLRSSLTALGGSLARGVFEPFTPAGDRTFEEYVA